VPLGYRNLEWINLNSERRYPLCEDAGGKDLSGTFQLPNDFLVGLILPVHWGMSVLPGKFFIRRISSQSAGYAVTVAYNGNPVVDVAVAMISKASHTNNQAYNLGGIGNFADSRGHVLIGTLDSIEQQPAGDFEFSFESGKLEVDCIRPQIRAVASLQVESGGSRSQELTGRVRLRSGSNHRIDVQTNEAGEPVITLNAISGEGLREECVCIENLQPVLSISGIKPDGAGNFAFLGSNCVEVVPGNAILTFEDTCSKPCCGPTELEKITTAMESFGSRATTLEQFLVSLEARVSTMDMIVLGARLGDRGCVPGQECPEPEPAP
jgi:hypothetical protein